MQFLPGAIIAAGILLPFAQLSSAEDSPSSDSDVPEVFPTETRDNAVWRQDDHIHTTPDQATQRFEMLDRDGDRRLQWNEVQVVDMDRHVFRTLDTDGSGSLDREEYIAVSPSPDNQYTSDAMPEP